VVNFTSTLYTKHETGNQKGFTIIELLVVIALIGLLTSIVMLYVRSTRGKARDVKRVQTLKTFDYALSIYRNDNNKYFWPSGGGGTNLYTFSYRFRDPGEDCAGDLSGGSMGAGNLPAGRLRFDNAASGDGMIEDFPTLYMPITFRDPLNRKDDFRTRYNCRYIVPCVWPPTSGVNCKSSPQQYYIHCALEVSKEFSKSDGGGHNDLFEVYEPYPWLCVTPPAS